MLEKRPAKSAQPSSGKMPDMSALRPQKNGRPYILMLTPYVPYPPVSGGRSRTFNLVKRLARDYVITLVSFARPEERAFDISPLEEFCEVHLINRPSSPSKLQALMLSLTSPRPITMRLYHTREFKETIATLLRVRLYDLVHVESFYMLQNLPRNLKVPVFLSEPAIEYIAWARHARVAEPWIQRPAIALEALKMRLFEPRTWRKVTAVGAMSDVDAAIMKKIAPKAAVKLSPNGVDVDYFKPSTIRREPENALFMGDYKYFPNEDAVLYFMREIMPIIKQKRPTFTLTLLGKDPTPALRAIAENPAAGLRIMGLVDDTRPYLNRASLFVCPLRSGSGTRFKLLEALACGCPVVSTALGAEGLGAQHGRHLMLADEPESFANAVLTLLNDSEEAARIARHGRNWVVDRHSWSRSAAMLSDTYLSLIGSEDLTAMSPSNRRARTR